MLEFLSLLNIIPNVLYKSIDGIRKARNDWIHEMTSVKSDLAYNAVKTAEKLINKIFNLNINVYIQFRFVS